LIGQQHCRLIHHYRSERIGLIHMDYGCEDKKKLPFAHGLATDQKLAVERQATTASSMMIWACYALSASSTQKPIASGISP
jgi:hypothetical protein